MKKKKWHVLIIVLIVILTVIIVAIAVNYINRAGYESTYASIENQYSSLQDKYDDLTADYNNLIDDHTTIQNNYNSLQSDYDILLGQVSEYSEVPIDHLMAMTYNEIREQIQPQYTSWWSTYYYGRDSAEYASYVSAHDLGRRHWPSIENDYYQSTGSYLTNDAHTIIRNVIDIADVSEEDSDPMKIEKILDFISDFITYQSDLNNEFLFPVETITFRSGDCDDFSILAAALLEEVGIESAVALFENESLNQRHCMVLVNLANLGNYGYWRYSDLTAHGLSEGNWIILEPQTTIERQHDKNLIEKWSIIAMAEIPNE